MPAEFSIKIITYVHSLYNERFSLTVHLLLLTDDGQHLQLLRRWPEDQWRVPPPLRGRAGVPLPLRDCCAGSDYFSAHRAAIGHLSGEAYKGAILNLFFFLLFFFTFFFCELFFWSFFLLRNILLRYQI